MLPHERLLIVAGSTAALATFAWRWYDAWQPYALFRDLSDVGLILTSAVMTLIVAGALTIRHRHRTTWRRTGVIVLLLAALQTAPWALPVVGRTEWQWRHHRAAFADAVRHPGSQAPIAAHRLDGAGFTEFVVAGDEGLPLVYVASGRPEDAPCCKRGVMVVKRLDAHWFLCARDWN